MVNPQAATSESKDPVFQEPENRTLAEPVRPNMVTDRDEEKSAKPSLQNDDDQLPSEEELDPRERIARKYEKDNYGIDHDDAPEPEPAAQGDKVETKPVEDELDTPPEPETVEIKVNGRTLTVDKAKVDAVGGVEFYQKQVAVGDGFKDLAEQRKRLDEEKAALEEEKRRLHTQQPNLPPADDSTQTSQDLPTSDDQRREKADLVKKHREALLDGDDKTADKLMMELLGSAQGSQPATQPIDPEELEGRVINKAVALMTEQGQQKEIRSAGDQFFGENPELLIDKRLFAAVDDETNVVAAEHPTWGTKQVMDEAYNRVQEWRGITPGSPKPSTPPTDRVSEKRSLRSPRAGTGRATTPPQKPPQTNSEYVTQLRKARGLE